MSGEGALTTTAAAVGVLSTVSDCHILKCLNILLILLINLGSSSILREDSRILRFSLTIQRLLQATTIFVSQTAKSCSNSTLVVLLGLRDWPHTMSS